MCNSKIEYIFPYLIFFSFSFLDMYEGKIDDMEKLGIIEPSKVKSQVLSGATEAAEMILRVDGIVKAAPRKRMPDHRGC